MDSSLRWNDYCLFAVNYEIIDFVNSLSPLWAKLRSEGVSAPRDVEQ